MNSLNPCRIDPAVKNRERLNAIFQFLKSQREFVEFDAVARVLQEQFWRPRSGQIPVICCVPTNST